MSICDLKFKRLPISDKVKNYEHFVCYDIDDNINPIEVDLLTPESEIIKKWKTIPDDIKQKLLIQYVIIESRESYTIEQYEKYILPVAEYDVNLSFFDIPEEELPKIK
ncbi:MAG: hypothetical protein OEL89_00255 [Candidatus Peregrinibacteria bacterium]|nr:hypothetical protein [Candidatus Peregrinibacteria bacterium]